MSLLELPFLLPKERHLTRTLGHSSLWFIALDRRHISSWGGEGLAGVPQDPMSRCPSWGCGILGLLGWHCVKVVNTHI